MKKILILIQYYDRDFEQAVKLLNLTRRFLELRPENPILVRMIRRADSTKKLPDEVVKTHTTKSKAVGYPLGCNGMAYDIMCTPWEADAVVLWEADDCPMALDWMEKLQLWVESLYRLQPNWEVSGALITDPIPHINGNLIFRPGIMKRVVLPYMGNYHGQAWDIFYYRNRPVYQKNAHACPLIESVWKTETAPKEWLKARWGKLIYIHGIKDDSALKFVSDNLDLHLKMHGIDAVPVGKVVTELQPPKIEKPSSLMKHFESEFERPKVSNTYTNEEKRAVEIATDMLEGDLELPKAQVDPEYIERAQVWQAHGDGMRMDAQELAPNSPKIEGAILKVNTVVPTDFTTAKVEKVSPMAGLSEEMKSAPKFVRPKGKIGGIRS
jgi:hypothetical protein